MKWTNHILETNYGKVNNYEYSSLEEYESSLLEDKYEVEARIQEMFNNMVKDIYHIELEVSEKYEVKIGGRKGFKEEFKEKVLSYIEDSIENYWDDVSKEFIEEIIKGKIKDNTDEYNEIERLIKYSKRELAEVKNLIKGKIEDTLQEEANRVVIEYRFYSLENLNECENEFLDEFKMFIFSETGHSDDNISNVLFNFGLEIFNNIAQEIVNMNDIYPNNSEIEGMNIKKILKIKEDFSSDLNELEGIFIRERMKESIEYKMNLQLEESKAEIIELLLEA